MAISEDWGPVTEDLLTRDLRIVQRKKGHRFSSDDIATAYAAVTEAPAAERVLDLGCGIGSVLLHLAWCLPAARLVGIEAQTISFEILKENLDRSGYRDRIEIQHGDLRALAVEPEFDLVTGTPPYFPPETASAALDPQRAYARIEYRGGIEGYVAAGAKALTPEGVLVLCGDARAEQRLEAAAQEVGLVVRTRTLIIAHAPKPPLFTVWALRRRPGPRVERALVLRDAEGRPAEGAALLRRFSGF